MSATKDHPLDLTDPHTVVNEMQLTAAELERRGERLLKMSRDLIAQASIHATLAALPDERTVGRNGVVTEASAIVTAETLRTFTRAEFAEALGIQPVSVSRWLAKLIDRKHPIVERQDDGSYAYIDPAPVAELNPVSKRAPKAKGFQTQFGTQAEGSGNTLRGMPKELRPIVRQAMGSGWLLTKTGSGHWTLSDGARNVGFAPTPRNPTVAANKLRGDLAGSQRGRYVTT